MELVERTAPAENETEEQAGLSGYAKVWAVSEPKAGTLTQCLGVGMHFDPRPIEKIVIRSHGLKKLFARPVFKRSESAPDIIISCGSLPERHVLQMQQTFGDRPLTVHLQRPKVEGYNLCFVSRHDWTPELAQRPNYHSVVGVPHRVSQRVLAPLRDNARLRYAPNNEKVAAIFVGGTNGAYAYDDLALKYLSNMIHLLTEQHWRVVVSTSRRSSAEILQTFLKLRNPMVDVWDRTGNNPFLDYMAAADAFLIGKDSITMPCEALVTGKPVYALELTHIPGDRVTKFERFHRDLQDVLGLTRPFHNEIVDYNYVPLDETGRIAKIISAALVSSRISDNYRGAAR
jgi:uncharacterized protein